MKTETKEALLRAYRIEGDRMFPPLSDEEIQRCLKRLESKCGDEPTDLEFCKTLSRYRKRSQAWYYRGS